MHGQLSQSAGALLTRENCKTLQTMAEAADIFMEAKRLRNSLIVRDKGENTSIKAEKDNTGSKVEIRCFVCGRTGHKASDCRNKVKQLYCPYCRKTGHEPKSCTKKNSISRPATSCLLLPKDETSTQQPTDDCDALNQDEDITGTVKTQPLSSTRRMPVLPGKVNGQRVRVLRDTGSNTLVVRRSLVPDEALTGTTATLWLADGSSIVVPEAKVQIRSPYFSGTVIVKCITTQLYDVIVGNVAGSREANDPDDSWKFSHRNDSNKREVHSVDDDNRPNSLLVGIKGTKNLQRLPSAKLPLGLSSRKGFDIDTTFYPLAKLFNKQ